jgi:hypothetical protein
MTLSASYYLRTSVAESVESVRFQRLVAERVLKSGSLLAHNAAGLASSEARAIDASD